MFSWAWLSKTGFDVWLAMITRCRAYQIAFLIPIHLFIQLLHFSCKVHSASFVKVFSSILSPTFVFAGLEKLIVSCGSCYCFTLQSLSQSFSSLWNSVWPGSKSLQDHLQSFRNSLNSFVFLSLKHFLRSALSLFGSDGCLHKTEQHVISPPQRPVLA